MEYKHWWRRCTLHFLLLKKLIEMLHFIMIEVAALAHSNINILKLSVYIVIVHQLNENFIYTDNCLIPIRVCWPFTWVICWKRKKLINNKLTCLTFTEHLMTNNGQVYAEIAIKTETFERFTNTLKGHLKSMAHEQFLYALLLPNPFRKIPIWNESFQSTNRTFRRKFNWANWTGKDDKGIQILKTMNWLCQSYFIIQWMIVIKLISKRKHNAYRHRTHSNDVETHSNQMKREKERERGGQGVSELKSISLRKILLCLNSTHLHYDLVRSVCMVITVHYVWWTYVDLSPLL